jgi:hypothetical protein
MLSAWSLGKFQGRLRDTKRMGKARGGKSALAARRGVGRGKWRRPNWPRAGRGRTLLLGDGTQAVARVTEDLGRGAEGGLTMGCCDRHGQIMEIGADHGFTKINCPFALSSIGGTSTQILPEGYGWPE